MYRSAMSDNEKPLVGDAQPATSTSGHHPISTGSHDQTPSPQELAGPSQSLKMIYVSRCD